MKLLYMYTYAVCCLASSPGDSPLLSPLLWSAKFGEIFVSKAHTPVHTNQAAFLQECIILMYTEYYLIAVLKQCCMEKTAQL